jgi:hypothetical protein
MTSFARKNLNEVEGQIASLDTHGCCRHLVGRGILGLCVRCSADVADLRRIGGEARNRRKADDITITFPRRYYHEAFMLLSRKLREEQQKPWGGQIFARKSYEYSTILDALIVAGGRGTRCE